MLEALKRSWRRFKENPPGKRFQKRFKLRQQKRRNGFQKAAFIGAGALLMAVGLFLLVAPGPGMIVLLVGASMIAGESLIAARLLDWIELRGRRLVGLALTAWRRSSLGIKILLVLLGATVMGAMGFEAHRLFF